MASKPIVAGWLNIVAGILWLLAVAWLSLVIVGFSAGFGMPHGTALMRLWLVLTALALPGFLAIAGGVFVLKRRGWLLALTASIGIIPLGLGIASVILVARSKNEFS